MQNEKYPNKDVMIGFPAYDGKTEVEIAQEMYMALYDPRIPVSKIHYYNGDSLVTRARNSVAAAFMDMDGVDYLMFIDSDIRFSREQIKTLRGYDKGVIGGVYLKKKLPYQPVYNHRLGKEEETGLTQMHEIGTGFMMIRKDVFKAIQERWPEHHYKPYSHERPSENYYDWFRVGKCPDTGYYLSEDYYFCKLARECGYDVFMDENILVEHSGKMLFPTNDVNLILGADVMLRAYNEGAPVSEELGEAVKRIRESSVLFAEKRGIK
jgi:hypothetical protein